MWEQVIWFLHSAVCCVPKKRGCFLSKLYFADWSMWWPSLDFWRWCFKRRSCRIHDENCKHTLLLVMWINIGSYRSCCQLKCTSSYHTCRWLIDGEQLISWSIMQVSNIFFLCVWRQVKKTISLILLQDSTINFTFVLMH